ncbi:hypothetical protein D3C81_1153250 [compost metagenome]
MLDGRVVGAIDTYCGLSVLACEITAGLWRFCGCRVRLLEHRVQVGLVRLFAVVDAHQGAGMAGQFKALGDHQCQRLPAIQHTVVE